MSTKHTPGPWQYQATNSAQAIVAADGEVIICDAPFGAYVSMEQEDWDLIAAAPDLLKELQHLVGLLDQAIGDGRISVPGLATLNGAKAAIAKATGEPE